MLVTYRNILNSDNTHLYPTILLLVTYRNILNSDNTHLLIKHISKYYRILDVCVANHTTIHRVLLDLYKRIHDNDSDDNYNTGYYNKDDIMNLIKYRATIPIDNLNLLIEIILKCYEFESYFIKNKLFVNEVLHEAYQNIINDNLILFIVQYYYKIIVCKLINTINTT